MSLKLHSYFSVNLFLKFTSSFNIFVYLDIFAIFSDTIVLLHSFLLFIFVIMIDFHHFVSVFIQEEPVCPTIL
jgi:hypothetical protein